MAIGISAPRRFAPGTNWDYSHTNYVILGRALQEIGGAPLDALLRAEVLEPLRLTGTSSSMVATVAEPALHAFSSERRQTLGIDPAVRFYEESTFWNPFWTLAEGAIQTTTIHDMTATAEAIGTGMLLSPKSHRARIAPDLFGFGALLDGCPACHTLDEDYNYGLGVVLAGEWILQNPLFAGCGSVEAYLPAQQIAIAVATTFAEEAFDEQGNNRHQRASSEIFAAVGALLAPDHAPPGGA